jgi:hypothetical protein
MKFSLSTANLKKLLVGASAAFHLFTVALPAQVALPLRVAGPPGKPANGDCFRELFEHPDQWKDARANIDMLLYAGQKFSPGKSGQFTDAELTTWFAQMRQWNLPLELEVGAVKEWGPTAQKTFASEHPDWDRILRLGGPFASLAMDEPLICTRNRLHLPDAYAVQETANFIALVRKNYPQVRIGDIEPYPSIPWQDHGVWIAALQKKLAEMNVRGLDFYRLDVNWISFDVANIGSWKEVQKIETSCRKARLPFSLIYWSSGYPLFKRLGIGDDSTWYAGVMTQGYAYASIGARPDQYCLESWVGAPAHSVPDSDPNAYMGSARDFFTRFARPSP